MQTYFVKNKCSTYKTENILLETFWPLYFCGRFPIGQVVTEKMIGM
jgi:hypothetical protein